jgi:hypothetical protein
VDLIEQQAQAEELFLLRQFHEALAVCYDALSKIAENTSRAFYYHGNSARSPVTLNPSNIESKVAEGNFNVPMWFVYCTKGELYGFGEKKALQRVKSQTVLSKMSWLYHECSRSNDGELRDNCECTPFMAIVVQSVFELQKETDPAHPVEKMVNASYQEQVAFKENPTNNLMQLLQHFYGSMSKIPFQILFIR